MEKTIALGEWAIYDNKIKKVFYISNIGIGQYLKVHPFKNVGRKVYIEGEGYLWIDFSINN